jgi:hypothetical protein
MLEVVLDRLLGQAQLTGDLTVGVALGDQPEDPLLLGRQAGQLLVLEQVLALAQPVQHPLGHGNRAAKVVTTSWVVRRLMKNTTARAKTSTGTP